MLFRSVLLAFILMLCFRANATEPGSDVLIGIVDDVEGGKTNENTEVHRVDVPMPAIGNVTTTGGQITVTTTFTPGSYVGQYTILQMQVQAFTSSPEVAGFQVRVRLTPGYLPHFLRQDDEAVNLNLHTTTDGFTSQQYFNNGTVNTVLEFRIRATEPGLHAAMVDVTPDPSVPDNFIAVDSFTWLAKQFDGPDLWADWNPTFPEGQLWYTLHGRFWHQKLRVHNSGQTASRSCVARFYKQLGRQFDLPSATLVHKFRIPALKPGEDYMLDPPISKHKIGWDYAMWIVLDADNAVDEGDEANNTYGLGP